MIPILLGAALALHLGPMGPDAPAREPQLASSGSTVALTFGAARTVYVLVSHDRGGTFSEPVKVAEVGVLPLSRHRGPHVAIAGDAIVITAVAGSRTADGPHAHGLPSDGDLLVWRSKDGGRTWMQGRPINDVPGAATEGLHALASDAKGRLFAVWLDKRGAKGTTLYAATSSDGGASWLKNVEVYRSPSGSICECCHPSAAIGESGEILVMWRNSFDGSRDLYLSSSHDGVSFAAPVKSGTGTWHLNACPMDGGGLAASGGKVLTAWRREGDIFLAERGRPEQKIGTGKDVALALSGGRTFAVWTGADGLAAWIDGKLEILAAEGSFAALCPLTGGGALAAWEQGGGIDVRRLR